MSTQPALVDNAQTVLAGVQKQLLGAHFLLLVRLLRKSARRDYQSFDPHNMLERRIVLALYRIGQGRVSELALHLGNDVAQVSRALTAMRKQDLVRRGRQRDPHRLTDRGYELGGMMDAVELRRELALTQGLEPLQMFELAGLLINLLQNASAILVAELAKTRDGTDEATEVVAPDLPPSMEIHSRVQPLIATLTTTISRAATAAYKRLTGISNFEWRLLVNIAERPGLRFTDIVMHVDSDKAQVSRTLDALVSGGLVARGKAGPSESVRFAISSRGDRLHDIMRDDALRRNALLAADLTAAQRQRLQSYLDLLIANASAMCADLD